MRLLDGKKIAGDIKSELKSEILALREKGIIPKLSVILVGDDPASRVYVKNKERVCQEIGIASEVICLPKETIEEKLLSVIFELNAKKEVHGILVQFPLPSHINQEQVVFSIDPKKDVDCFHPENIGRMFLGNPTFLPCTPAGIIEILKQSHIELSGSHAVIVGRSNIVGKPLAIMLLHENATVTVCHSKTKNLQEICRKADILISAVGKIGLIGKDMVKQSAVVVDVGINRNANGELVGDVDFEAVKEIASALTPVPGGVGPMTIAILMKNTVRAASFKNNKSQNTNNK